MSARRYSMPNSFDYKSGRAPQIEKMTPRSEV
jgi:hypothetical protein